MTNKKAKLRCEKAKENIMKYSECCLKEITSENPYLKSYPALIRSTKILYDNSDKNGDLDFILTVAHIAYGWMPRVLSNHTAIENHNAMHFRELRDINSPDQAIQRIKDIKEPFIDNSWAGMSKTLHFINPELFPIWDSKVASNFGLKVSNIHIYTDYIRCIHNLIADKDVISHVNKVQIKMNKFSNPEVSKVRACEYILYIIGKSNIANR